MASNLLVTGKWGEVHVTSAQQRNFNSGVVGDGQYVMDGLTATMSDSNTLHVNPGVACMNGADVEVPAGGADVVVTNGTQGMLRNDLICMRYTMEGSTQKESVELVCVRGTPAASDPQDPEYNDGSILDGSLVVDMPLYRVSLNGITPGEPEPIFEVTPSLADLRDSVSQNRWQTLLTNAAHYARSGGLVVVQIYNLTLQKGVRRSVGTLPVGFRPTGAATWDGRSAVGPVYGGGSNFAYAYVSPGGEVWCDYAVADGDYTGQLVFPA